MTLIEHSPEIQVARKLRQKLAIDQLDYRRALQRLANLKMSQRELSAHLGISQPTLSKTLSNAASVPAPRAGFSGADPYEVAQRYAVGEITREQVIDQLTRWDYKPGAPPTDGYDSLVVSVPGSVDDVVRAFDDGLLEDEVYDTILIALSAVTR